MGEKIVALDFIWRLNREEVESPSSWHRVSQTVLGVRGVGAPCRGKEQRNRGESRS